MPLTNAEKQKRAREKRAAILRRYEAALREIEAANAVDMALDPQWASRVANRALHIEV